MTVTRLVLVLVVAAALRPPPLGAHAFLDHAEPRVGAVVAAPKAVTLWFTEPIEPAFSRIEVDGPDKKPVSTPPLEHPEPRVLSVTLPDLGPGEYQVRWSVVSVDTHPTDGKFSFEIERR